MLRGILHKLRGMEYISAIWISDPILYDSMYVYYNVLLMEKYDTVVKALFQWLGKLCFDLFDFRN